MARETGHMAKSVISTKSEKGRLIIKHETAFLCIRPDTSLVSLRYPSVIPPLPLRYPSVYV